MPTQPLGGKARESVRQATARGNLWEGAVRSSKTVSSIVRWLKYVRNGPPGALLMVGKTERTLKRNIIDPIQAMVGVKRCRFKVGVGELELFGRTIYVVGANDERSSDKIKGLTLSGAYCDELTTYPESFFSMLTTRLSVPGAQWFATTNPEGPGHWVKKKYVDRAKLRITRDGQIVRSDDPTALDLHTFAFQLADNPTLPAAYVEELKREYVGLFYRRYVLGEWCLAEGVVYDMWDPDKHVVTTAQMPAISRHIALGIDYGTVNPFAGLLLGLGADQRLYLTNEYRYDSKAQRRSLTDAEYSRELTLWLDKLQVFPEWTAVDPSAASFVQQLYRDGRVTPTLANNSVIDGIRQLSSLLATDRLRVHDSCKGWIEEIPGYSWDPKKALRGEDAPIKVGDHSLDAGRYAVHTTEAIWHGQLKEAA